MIIRAKDTIIKYSIAVCAFVELIKLIIYCRNNNDSNI